MALHLEKVKAQVLSRIPTEASRKSGLAVIDFEAWRPLWDDDFDLKNIPPMWNENSDRMNSYRNASIEYTQSLYPFLNESTLTARAKEQFEESARSDAVSTKWSVTTVVVGVIPKFLLGITSYPH